MSINNELRLEKRTNLNNTHINIVDEAIKSIETYKINKTKRIFAIILYILSLGILYFLLKKFFPSFYLSLNCEPSYIYEADYFVITAEESKKYIVPVVRRNLLSNNDNLKGFNIEYKNNKISNYIDQESNVINKDTIILYFRHNKYTYSYDKNCMASVNFDLSELRNCDLFKKFRNGITNIEDYNYLLNKFELNQIEMTHKNFFKIFLDNLINPLYIYQIYAQFAWLLDDYYTFSIIVFIFSVIILLVNSFYKYKLHKSILNQEHHFNANVIRNITIDQNNNIQTPTDIKYIVPGDIISLDSNDKPPCDCIILEGLCTVNESNLTGESTIISKTSLPVDDRYFSYENYSKSILYFGTHIIKCESLEKDHGKIKALVINTGFNTSQGNLIQNLLFPRPTNFKFYNDVKLFVYVMVIIWIIVSIIKIILFNNSHKENIEDTENYENPHLKLLKRIIDDLTVVIPPILPICMTLTSFYFHINLMRKNIFSISDTRMNAAGRMNIILLDKTGTLTEEGLELFGFQTTMINHKKLESAKLEQGAEIYNLIYKEFYKNLSLNPIDPNFDNYLKDYKNNIIYFVECLATCHSIDKIKNDHIGNSIDKAISDKIKWNQEKNENFWGNKLIYNMIPKNSYKITEQLFFKNINNRFSGKKFILTIIKRFEFSSKFQSMSVIVKNNFDLTYRYFIKGAPEKIIQFCEKDSIPIDYENKLIEHTRNGFRVLACATKILDNNNEDTLMKSEDRNSYQNNLTFLGFILFMNKLKRDTKKVISKLKNSFKVVISTGDNVYTSISVAKECELIDNDNSLFLIDIDESLQNIKITPLLEDDEYNKLINEDKKIILSKSTSKTKKKVSNKVNDLHSSLSSRRKINDRGKSYLSDEKIMNNYKIKIDEYIERIENNINARLCISGTALNLILKKESVLLSKSKNFISDKAVIFFRMSPNDKVKLVNFYKENERSIVGMCGDGANDCGALLSADVGIILNNKKNSNSITAHFNSSDDSISCVLLILKNGRACYENNIILLKYLILYAVIQLTSVLILSTIDKDITNDQYLFIDFFLVMMTSLIFIKTGPNYDLTKKKPPHSIINLNFLSSIIGHIIIQVINLIVFFIYFKNNRVNLTDDHSEDTDHTEEPTLLISNVFIFTCFQIINNLISFNSFSKHRKNFFANKAFLFYLILLISYLITITCIPFFKNNFFGRPLVKLDIDLYKSDYVNEENKLILFGFIALNFILTYSLEFAVDKIVK